MRAQGPSDSSLFFLHLESRKNFANIDLQIERSSPSWRIFMSQFHTGTILLSTLKSIWI
jgi:hypothetical protein